MSRPEVGITGVGAHVPRYRLSAETLAAVWGSVRSGTRAVANHDEDSLTMAAEAGLAAIGDGDGANLDLVCLATTTPRTPRSLRPRSSRPYSTAGPP